MKKLKKSLVLILTILLPFQGFNAIAMEDRKHEEIESNSTNGIRARSHHGNLAISSTTSEEETDIRAARRARIENETNFCLNVLLCVTGILLSIAKIVKLLFSK